MTLQSYGIASGWNQTPTNVESITPSGAQSSWLINSQINAYYFVQGLGRYLEPRERSAGATTFRNGFETVEWLLQASKYEALADFYQTYVIDSGGAVSVSTTVLSTTYDDYNAVITMTQPREATRFLSNDGLWVLGVSILLELRGAIP